MSKDEPDAVPDSENDELFYSELLDLMQAANDAALLQSEEPGDLDPKYATTTTVSTTTNTTDNPIKPYFVVGGSLFAQRYAPQQTPWRESLDLSGDTRLTRNERFFCRGRHRFAQMGVLRRGSLFCPFTKQFFSLSSPHWQHLKLSGFAVDASMQNGRRVQLLYPRILYRLACLLQRTIPSFTEDARLPGAGDALFATADTVSPRSVYAERGWSPGLAHTLGSLLEKAPTKTFKEFHCVTVKFVRQESGVMSSRRIPLSRAQLGSPRQSAPHQRVAPFSPFLWHEHKLSFLMKEPPVPLVELGHAFIQEATRTRRRALQEESMLVHEASFCSKNMTVEVMEVHNDASHAALLALLSPVAASLEPPRIRLPGMTWSARAAYFRVPFWRGANVPGGALPATPMLSVCASLLRYFLQEKERGDACTGVCEEGSLSLFFCPVEHSVDYNSVLDLDARMIRTVGDIERVEGAVGASLGRRVPMLSLGLENETAGAKASVSGSTRVRVVVVANAHLLSRRALSRLLDQWTRNGAAGCALRATRGGSASAVDRGQRAQWQLLMSVEPFTKCVRTHYASPFGSVRVVFVGLDFESRVPSSLEEEEATSHAAPVDLVIDPAPKESIFHLVEPLSAALLHASALTLHMGQQERVLLLQDVVRCVQASPGGQTELTAKFSKTLPSGRVLISQSTHALSSERGALLLYEGCEALLTAAMRSATSEHLESVLATYPFLSHLKCRHDLLSAYHVRLRFGEKEGSSCAPPALPIDPLPRAPVELVLTSSRAEAAGRVQRALEGHARVARAAALSKAVRGTARRREDMHVYQQAFSSFIEPPLLLGRWTPTFFLCAPLVADVTPLARYALEELRRLCRWTHDGTLLSLDIVTVDVYHVDFIVFPKARRCRLFGLRALYERRELVSRTGVAHSVPSASWPSSAVTVYADPQVELARLLQSILKDCASRALFFPMWTYNVSTSSPLWRQEGAEAADIGVGDVPRTNGQAREGFSFGSVHEGCVPTVPNIVERRLFSLAATQHPVVSLAVGCHVLLLSPIHYQSSPREGPPRVAVPTGSILRVTDFIPAKALQNPAAACHVPDECAWHVKNLPANASALTELFLGQQASGGELLPIVECVHAPPVEPQERWESEQQTETEEEATASRHYVLLPQPFLVGGYPSLHYYTLPLLHLPVVLLEGGVSDEARRVVKRRKNISSRAPHKTHPIPFCYSALEFLHPYHRGPRSIATLLFQARERVQVVRFLLKELEKGKEKDLVLFTEDIPFSPHAQSTYLQKTDPGTQSELQAQTSVPLLPVEKCEAAAKLEFTCLSMTELSLFARHPST